MHLDGAAVDRSAASAVPAPPVVVLAVVVVVAVAVVVSVFVLVVSLTTVVRLVVVAGFSLKYLQPALHDSVQNPLAVS